MKELEKTITPESLGRAKSSLVPFIFTENYYHILKKKLIGKEQLSENERYYYSHFIKKKLEAMIELFGMNLMANGKQFIRKDRLQKAMRLVKKYSRKHKNMKILVSGSFLFSRKYNDIDVFVISKYSKEDYADGIVHVNYLPESIEKTLFFRSIYSVSVANFKSDAKIEEKFKASDILHLYEIVVLLMIQGDKCLQELRDLIVRLEYLSNNVVLDTMQLKIIADKIINAKNPVQTISKYLIAKIITSYNRKILAKALRKFIEKNSFPEKGRKVYKNWEIYNQTYKEAMEVVA